MNESRQTLKTLSIGGLVLGAVLLVFGFVALSNDGGIGAAITTWIGSAVFSLGVLALLFWLLAESIAHGQRALIQNMERLAAGESATAGESVDAGASENAGA